MVLIHVFSALILSFGLARLLGRWRPRWIQPNRRWLWIMVGLLVAGATVLIGRVVEAFVETVEAGYAARMATRVLWCVALQLPWCLLAQSPAATSSSNSPQFSTLGLLSLGFVTAVGVPVSFLAVFLEQQTGYAREYWEQQHVREAQRLVQRLCDIGSPHAFGERTVVDSGYQRTIPVDPRRARLDLNRAVEYLRGRVEQLKSGPANDTTQMELAETYESLGEDENAEQVLRSLAERSPIAALKIAEIHLRQKRPESSRSWAEKALQLAQAAPSSDDQQRASLESIQLRAYDMLAVFAGEKADFEQAEGYLQEALERLPMHAAHIHDRLAKHYEFIGELKQARDHQQQAADLDPDRYLPPEPLVRKMLSTGAPVGLARPKSSRYQ